MKSNIVFIATSLDGYISDKNGGIDWLHSVPNPDQIDMGYGDLMNRIDALVIGRNTYETVLSFGIDWPYNKPVFVLSNSLKEIPAELSNKVFIINGELPNIVKDLNSKGFNQLYIDGGKTIQSFLSEGLINEFIITKIPLLLGGGTPLFGNLDTQVNVELIKSEVFLENIVQLNYKVVQ